MGQQVKGFFKEVFRNSLKKPACRLSCHVLMTGGAIEMFHYPQSDGSTGTAPFIGKIWVTLLPILFEPDNFSTDLTMIRVAKVK
jgi:hypothetical protein